MNKIKLLQFSFFEKLFTRIYVGIGKEDDFMPNLKHSQISEISAKIVYSL